jgi:hypothetical protein
MNTTRFPEPHRDMRGHDFYRPTDALASVPPLYATEGQALAEKAIHLHYFTGSSDWWVIELDPAEMLAWGYVNLGDPDCAEFGYIDLTELCGLRTCNALLPVIERDLHWTVKTVAAAALPGRSAA